jgi:hypothetical protein
MPSIAIIGGSNNRRKFGNKAVRAYLHEGWDVYPVHPHESCIEGLIAYKTIADVPRPIGRAALYLPPQVTMGIIADIARAVTRPRVTAFAFRAGVTPPLVDG